MSTRVPDPMTDALDPSRDSLARLAEVIASRRGGDPDKSYVARLFHKGTDAICKKVAEEAAETIMASKDGDVGHVVREVTDLWFHSMVLLAHHGLTVDDVLHEFRRREGISGIDEKRSRTNG